MKRVRYLLLTFIFSFFILPLNIWGDGNMKVKFSTTFIEDIDIANLKTIYVMMDDAKYNEYEVALKLDNDFSYELTNVLEGEVKITNIFIKDDYSGIYSYSYEKNQVASDLLEIRINVSLSPKKEVTPAEINDAIYADIFGDEYMDRITVAGEYETDEEYVDSGTTSYGSGNGNNGGTTNTTVSTETTTNEYGQTPKDLEEQSKKIEESQREAKRQEEIKKRNKIYIYVLIAFICIIVTAIVVLIIKFSKANK